MSKLKVIAAVLDTSRLTLYHPDGSTTELPQGDARIRPILDYVTPRLAQPGAMAEIDLEQPNSYAAFEKKTNGFIKLFRVAKKVVEHLFVADEDREPLAPVTIGEVPKDASPNQKTLAAVNTVADLDAEKTQQARDIDEIMAHAEPVSSPSFKESATTDEHTIIAVTRDRDGTGAKVVPGVEALKDQFAHAAKLGSTQGVENLIRRLGAVIAEKGRGHSVQDVLRFLERGDLPIADDGSIIAYKILRRHGSLEGVFVDCHTRKVMQKVGSYVCVDESLVDRNRRNECSNGLHIARRGYLGSFSGDVCVLTKIDPEDVVTVPHNDPNKVRVCGYHILGLIPDREFQTLKNDRPMTGDSEAQKLLGQAISGQHIGRLEQVKITKQSGEGVVITPLVQGKAPKAPKLEQAPAAVALDDPSAQAGAVDPKAVSQEVVKAKAETAPKPDPKPDPKVENIIKTMGDTRAGRAQEMVKRMLDTTRSEFDRRRIAVELGEFKRDSKLGWGALGVTTKDLEARQALLDKPVEQKIVPLAPATPAQPTKSPPASPRREKAQELGRIMRDRTQSIQARCAAARELMTLKQTKKVSWETLGFAGNIESEVKGFLG